MSLKKNVIYNTLLSASQVLIPLITFPYTSRVLGPNGTGQVGFADSLTNYFVVFAALGIPYYGIREVAKVKTDRNKLNQLFTELFLLHIIATVVLILVYLVFILCFQRLNSNATFFLIGCAILLTNVFPVEWLFQGLEEFKFITIRTLVIRVMIIILLFFVVKSPKDAILLYVLNFFTVFINAVINFRYCKRFVTLTFTQLNLKKHLNPLFNLLASNLAINVYILIDSVILGFMSNDTAVGYYTSSSRINKMILNCVASFGFVLIPQVSSAYNDNNKERVKELISKSLSYVILVGIPIGLGMFLLAPQIIELLAGPTYYPAITTIKILSPLTLLMSLSSVFAIQVLNPIGKEKYLTYCVIAGMFVSIACNIVLIPSLQYNGTAITSIFTEIIIVILTYNLVKKFIGIKFNYYEILTAILSSLIFIPIYFFSLKFSSSGIVIIITNLLGSTLSYFLIQYYFFNDSLTRYLVAHLLFSKKA